MIVLIVIVRFVQEIPVIQGPAWPLLPVLMVDTTTKTELAVASEVTSVARTHRSRQTAN